MRRLQETEQVCGNLNNVLYLTEQNQRNKFRTKVERVVPRWKRYPEQPKRVVPFEAHNIFDPESAQWAHNPCAQPERVVPFNAHSTFNPESAQPLRTTPNIGTHNDFFLLDTVEFNQENPTQFVEHLHVNFVYFLVLAICS